MKKVFILNCILFFIPRISISQTYIDSTYGNLEVKKVYITSESNPNTNTRHSVIRNPLTMHELYNLQSAWGKIDTCCPCILQFIDENNILRMDAIVCDGSIAGSFTEYYPNGKIKLQGNYKENQTDIWDFLLETGKCCYPDGIWTYFNENGDTLYAEFWDNENKFHQVPEQVEAEFLFMDLELNGEVNYSGMMSFDQVKDLYVTPYFKNSHREGINLTFNFKIIPVGHQPIIQSFALVDFKSVDVLKMLVDSNIPEELYFPDEEMIDLYPGDIDTSYFIEICNNGIVIAYYEIYLYP